MKKKQKGVSTAAMTITVAVVAVVVVAGAVVFLMGGPKIQPTGGIAMNATATVKLHDAGTIDVGTWVSLYPPPTGVTITATGTITVNSFSASNVTVKLHNKTADLWITIVEGVTVTDMTVPNDLVAPISAGTYDKVSVYIGSVSSNVSWTDIVVSGTADPTQFGAPAGTPLFTISETIPAGSTDMSFTIDHTFTITLSPEVTVTEVENQVFDVDTGPPFDMYEVGNFAGPDPLNFQPQQPTAAEMEYRMEAHGEEGGAGPGET